MNSFFKPYYDRAVAFVKANAKLITVAVAAFVLGLIVG